VRGAVALLQSARFQLHSAVLADGCGVDLAPGVGAALSRLTGGYGFGCFKVW
jgi:hypothetical protein